MSNRYKDFNIVFQELEKAERAIKVEYDMRQIINESAEISELQRLSEELSEPTYTITSST